MRCTYCNDLADTMDHVIPISRQRTCKRTHTKEKLRKTSVPACRECNCLLGNKEYLTISSRSKYLHDRYLKRYSKLLAMPDWDLDDLDELEHALRTMIEFDIVNKSEVNARIAWCLNRFYDAPDIPDIWLEVDLQL